MNCKVCNSQNIVSEKSSRWYGFRDVCQDCGYVHPSILEKHEHTSSYYHIGVCMTCGEEHPNVKGLGLTKEDEGKP